MVRRHESGNPLNDGALPILISYHKKNTVYKHSNHRRQIMLRQSDIAAAFRESILRSSKGFQYLHTRDFVTALRRRGIHLSEVEANSWIAREQSYFVDKTAEHSENRLWMMAEMERELIVERTRAGLAAAREQGRVGGRRRVMTEEVVSGAAECWRTALPGSRWLM